MFFKLKWTFYLYPSVCWVKVEIDHNIVATCKCLNVETLLFMFFCSKNTLSRKIQHLPMSSVFSSLNIDRAAKMIYEIIQSDRYLLVCLLKKQISFVLYFFLLSTDVNLLEITLMMLFGMGPHKAAELLHVMKNIWTISISLTVLTCRTKLWMFSILLSRFLLGCAAPQKTQKKTSSSL